MERYNTNLKARKIKLGNDDIYMVSSITEKKLRSRDIYVRLPSATKDILKSNVLIAATTDNIKRLSTSSEKVDVIIANIEDAITLVLKDLTEASADILT